MPEGNPLVAQAHSQTTGVTGIGILESSNDLASGVKDGSWVEGGLGALGVGLEVLSLVVDPIGTLAQYGVSWLIEHVKPLKDCLDWLAGNPPVIQSFSDTWANVAREVAAIAGDLSNEAKGGTAGWSGAAGDAYRGEVAEQVDAVAGAASLCDGISTGVMVMGQVVAAVRETVRDLIAELVGKLISWALEEACTLGFATPLVAAQATTAITSTISKVSQVIRKLVKTISNVGPKVRKIVDKLGEIIEKLSKLAKKLGRKADGATSPSAARKAGKTDVDAPKEHTSPSSTHDTPDGTSADGTPSSKADAPGTASRGEKGSPNRPDDLHDTKSSEQARTKCSDPVDVVRGEVILTQTDVYLAGALPLVLRRTHVSSYRAGGMFGRSWASTIDQRLEFDDQGVVFLAEDGMVLVYPEPPVAGQVFPLVGARWPLSRTGEGFRIEQPESGHSLHFRGAAEELGLSAVSDRNGNEVSFVRDAAGQVTDVLHSGGCHVRVESDSGAVTAYVLVNPDGDDIVLKELAHENHLLTRVTNSSGRQSRFEYDIQGRIVRWEDRNGEWYRYSYDNAGRCIANEGSGGFLNARFEYEHLVTRFIDSLGNVRTFYFNEAKQVIREVDPLGNAITQEWDEFDRLLARTDALGRTTRFGYDDDGNLAELTRPDGTKALAEYNEFRRPVSIVEPDGAIWRSHFDEAGNLIAAVDPLGATTTYLRDDRGNVIAKTDVLGNTRRVERDAAGLVVAIIEPGGQRTSCVRDLFGRVVAVNDPRGGVTGYSWTVEGRLLSCVRPDGGVERAVYDSEGNQVQHVDAAGAVSRTRTTHFDLPLTEVLPDGSEISFGYDTELRMTSVTNAEGLIWRYEYDAAGHLVRERDFNGRVLTYAYDAAGQLTERVNAVGQRVELVRDALGNVVESRCDGTSTTFAFDAAGRLLHAANAEVDLVFQRDGCGRVLAESVNGRILANSYDLAGRRVRRVTPSGVESEWRYDERGRPSSLSTAGRTMTFGHDQAGFEVERILDSGTILAQAWDVNGRLAEQTVSTVAGTDGSRRARLLQARKYRYRADGNLTSIEDELAGSRYFQFDQSGRITSVEGPGGVERYAYDRTGNVSAAAWPEPDTTLQGTRSYAGTLVRQAGQALYHHDPQGRVVVKQKKRLSRKPDVWHYSWNAQDQLVGVVTPDGSRWQYVYDPLGRRSAKRRVVDGKVVEEVVFVWDGTTLAEQRHSEGTNLTWDWEPGSFKPLTQTERSQVAGAPQSWVDERFYSIITDLVGAPSELIDVSGNVAWRASSTIWGRALTEPAAGPSTPLRFPGQYFDAETGLNYNVHRHYDPDTGRYQSADPLGLQAGPSPHSYVHNPAQWFDPLGLVEVCDDALDDIFDRHGPEVTQGIEYQYRRMNDEMSALPEDRNHWIRDIGDDPHALADYFAGFKGKMTHVDAETGALVTYDRARGVLIVEKGGMIHGYHYDASKFDSGRYTART